MTWDPPHLEDGNAHRLLQSYRHLHMLGTFHTCPRMLREQCRHTGRTCISPCRCRARRPRTCTSQCCCCSCSTPPSSRFRSDTRRSHRLHDLRRAHRGSEHRNNCHTRSKVHRRGQKWRHDTHTVHNNSGPDRCISQSHWLRGNYATKRSPHCIHNALLETLADTRRRHTGKLPDPQCIGCCLL